MTSDTLDQVFKDHDDFASDTWEHYLQDGQSALILFENTPEEIGRVLTRAITDPELRATIGRGARKVYESSFNMRTFAGKLCEALGLHLPATKGTLDEPSQITVG